MKKYKTLFDSSYIHITCLQNSLNTSLYTIYYTLKCNNS